MSYQHFLIFAFSFVKAILKNPLNLYRPILYIFYKLIGLNVIIYKPSTLKDYQMVLDLNSHMDRSIFLSGLFGENVEINLYKFLSKNLTKDSIFFDIGANSGYFSLLASAIAKNGFIHAFEPVQKTYKNFKKTIQLNKIKNIKLNNLCLGAKSEVVKFYVDESSDVSSLRKTSYQDKSRLTKSQMVRLADYCRENSINKIDIIKIDTEGGEKDILFSSKEILAEYKPILIVEFSSETARAFGFHPTELYDSLEKMGYKMYAYQDGRLKPQTRQQYYPTQDFYCFYKK